MEHPIIVDDWMSRCVYSWMPNYCLCDSYVGPKWIGLHAKQYGGDIISLLLIRNLD